MLVAVGDSMTSGHQAASNGFGAWFTTCDNPGTGAAAPGSSWAGNLRALIGVPWNRYFNFAHSGSATTDVLTTSPYTDPCGVASQPAVPQIGDATALLQRWPSAPGAANVAVSTAGINDTNWVAVATKLVKGQTPAWATGNAQACTDWVLGNRLGNPGAPPGVITPAWNGEATSRAISGGTAQIALSLIAADPGAQVRQLLYYRWIGDPNLPRVCNPAVNNASNKLNGWVTFGVTVAKVVWAFARGDARRIRAVCPRTWNPGPNFIQTRKFSFGVPNWKVVPGWPHPNAAGRTSLAACVNGTLPRAAGGGIA
jgi:hypothetical protein